MEILLRKVCWILWPKVRSNRMIVVHVKNFISSFKKLWEKWMSKGKITNWRIRKRREIKKRKNENSFQVKRLKTFLHFVERLSKHCNIFHVRILRLFSYFTRSCQHFFFVRLHSLNFYFRYIFPLSSLRNHIISSFWIRIETSSCGASYRTASYYSHAQTPTNYNT